MSIHFLRTYRPALNSFAQTMRHNAFQTTKPKRFMSDSQKVPPKPALKWKRFLIVGTLTAGALYYLKLLKDEKDRRHAIERQRRLSLTPIGSSFELVDGDNKLRSSEEFKGKWLLIYFGFTHCPDICPDELDKIVKALEIIESKRLPQIQPLFITVDPDRDTPEIVGNYIKEFSPKFIGLTGTRAQVEKVCKSFRVYFNAGPKDEDKDYIVDHSIITYLMTPDGLLADYYGSNRVAEEMAKGIEFQMAKYEKLKKPENWFISFMTTKKSSNS